MKVYRVRQKRTVRAAAASDFGCFYTGDPYVAQAYPKDCPIAFEDMPLPGDTVVDRHGRKWVIDGVPYKSEWMPGCWCVTVYRSGCARRSKPLDYFPNILWAKRKQEDRVVGTVTVDRNGYAFSDLAPGEYEIVRKGDCYE